MTAPPTAPQPAPDPAPDPARQPRRVGRDRQLARLLSIGVPFLWLGLFFLLPFVIVLQISLAETALAQPPYTALWEWLGDGVLAIRLNFQNYLLVLADPLYAEALVNSLTVALVATALCLLLGYPMAWAIATAPPHRRVLLLMLVVLPFWTSFLIRVYAWLGILKSNGVLNNLLLWFGLIDQPLVILDTALAVYIGVVYSYLPFMILPLYANLSRLDPLLLEAAADLGARPLAAFARVTLPLSLPGIVAGSMLVFIPVVGEFVIPALLGPPNLMIGGMLWEEFFQNNDWPLASAVAILLLALLVVPFVLMQRLERGLTGPDEPGGPAGGGESPR